MGCQSGLINIFLMGGKESEMVYGERIRISLREVGCEGPFTIYPNIRQVSLSVNSRTAYIFWC
jgi:hypothetical protein